MGELGICYVADETFLFPTLLSAMSLRRFVPVGTARVFVVVFLSGAVDLEALSAGTRHLGLEFIGVTPESLPTLSGFDWSATHVAPAAIGRFLLPGLLPPEIDRILYLDGDTRVVGSLDLLLAQRVPEGSLAAADDAVILYRSDRSKNGRFTRSYLEGIGVPDDRGYFNSGGLLVGRQTWTGMAARALEYLLEHADRCTYHDQSALNATVGLSRVRLSPIWNFQTRFRSWGAPASLVPRILHFTGAAKPWMGAVAPWEDVAASITEDAAGLRPLGLPLQRWRRDQIEAHNAEVGTFKERLRRLIDLRRRLRARAVVRLHSEAAF